MEQNEEKNEEEEEGERSEEVVVVVQVEIGNDCVVMQASSVFEIKNVIVKAAYGRVRLRNSILLVLSKLNFIEKWLRAKSAYNKKTIVRLVRQYANRNDFGIGREGPGGDAGSWFAGDEGGRSGEQTEGRSGGGAEAGGRFGAAEASAVSWTGVKPVCRIIHL